jgi:hypothetical protein
MIVADLPQYKAARTKAHALNLEIDELTMTLDRHDAEFHNQGIPTPQSVLSTLRTSRSAKRFELRKLEIELSDMKEAFRIKGQNDLLDNLIAVCRENNNGQYLGAAMRRLEDAVFEDVEEGTPA